jgi:hypothetical protein
VKKIVVTFDTHGDSKVEAFGFSGGACLAATKSIEEAIGKASGRTMKSSGDGVEAKATVTR